MARTLKDARMDTRAARDRLAERHEPYWRLISEGEHLGYRKGARGGKWVVRFRPRAGGAYTKTTLGKADDHADADGDTVLNFRQAQERARVWFEGQQTGTTVPAAPGAPYTVGDALDDYMAWFRRHRKSVRYTEGAIEAHIRPEFGGTNVAELTAATIRDWLYKLADAPARLRSKRGKAQRYREAAGIDDKKRARKATANRVLTVLKAALNHGFNDGKVASDGAWRRVRPFREVESPRVRYLTLEEAGRLVNACSSDLRRLVQAALFTGMRYGELTALMVADFNPDSGTVAVRQSKAGKARYVILTDEGIGFFDGVTAGRPGTETMLCRADGRRWGKSDQRRPLLEACKRAKIDPPTGFHTLRHTYASHLVMNGAPLQVVAINLGHADTRMTERHYAHLAPSFVADAIRAASPTWGSAPGSEVAALRIKTRSASGHS